MTEQFANFAQSTLSAAITAKQTTISIATPAIGQSFPLLGNFRIVVQTFDPTTLVPTSAPELMIVTAVQGNTFTVIRGAENTVAMAFPGGANVACILTAGVMQAISSGGSGTVTEIDTGTGLTGGPITTTGTISLANTAVSPGSYTNTNLTVDQQGRITAASNGSGGGVASVSNSDGTLTISPTTGNVVGSLNLAHENLWTAPIDAGTLHSNNSFYITAPTMATRTSAADSWGFTFQVTLPITISQFGRLYVSGNVQDHTINLWDVTNTSTPLATGTVLFATSSQPNGFKYVNITPVTLVPGKNYSIGSNEGGVGADIYGGQGDFTAIPGTTVSSIFGNIIGAWSLGAGYNSIPRNNFGVSTLPYGDIDMIFSYVDTSMQSAGFATTGVVAGSSLYIGPTTSGGSGVLYQGGANFLHSFGTQNTFVGQFAGNFTGTGTNNTSIGTNSLLGLINGGSNSAFGVNAGTSIQGGNGNSLFGNGAGNTIINGSNNVSFGDAALVNVDNASSGNVAIGKDAARGNGSDAFNNSTYVGSLAGSISDGFGVGGLQFAGGLGFASYVSQSNAIALGAKNGSGFETDITIGGIAPAAKLHVISNSTSKITEILQAFASQTADILQIQNSSNAVLAKVDVSGNITGASLIKTGGTSSQFLKADGSVDSTVYATAYYTWSTVTGTSQSGAVNNAYILNNAGLVTLILPSTAAIGDKIIAQGQGAGGWKIAQNAGQLIHFGSSTTTTGTGGSLASTNQWDTVELVCVVANTTWATRNVIGILTVV